jgi:serine/threonine protein kinase/tetratricopeptide (TPR) repeat protein
VYLCRAYRMDEKKSKVGRGQETGGGGLRAPAKGESSSSGLPLDNDGMTFIERHEPPTKPPDDPGATVVHENLTLDGTASVKQPSAPRSSAAAYRDVILKPGDVIGGRYEILELLGEGGMGAVYKARDLEVDRFVALKLIRPELASNPEILARFKQELLTAHQVTHKNVIRIYDIAEADGVKFITMEYIEGDDLRKLLVEKGKLPPQEAVEIIRKVCHALDAAHSVGIIHRDLKPQNIMRDKQGRILVMDFGLARSLRSEGMTQTGALLGTIEYMSPEQAMGKSLDQRSDIFALGLIFYELLSGKVPYKAETAMASLLRRNQERAVPLRELDESVPGGLSDIVSKCLERDLNLRYQNVTDILSDLDAWEGKRPIAASVVVAMPAPKRPIPWKWIATGSLAVIATVGGLAFKDKLFKSGAVNTPAAAPQLSLAILPFHNATADPSMDWLGSSLADMLSTDVGQSAQMRTVSPDRIHQIYADLRITPNANVDPDTLGRIAEFSNADTVVYGQYAKFGNQIRIDATLEDRRHNRKEPLKVEAANEQGIPATVDKLAELIRNKLSLSSDVLNELKASSFQPSSKSMPALKDYNQGVQLFRDGKNLEAVKSLQSAIQADPQFALAYSRLAESESALGYDADAEKHSRKALELSQPLPAAEKYLIEATHARIIKDNKKAVEAYENLAKIMPDNADVEYALGSLYLEQSDYDKAKAQFSKILQSDPKDVKALWRMGVVEINRDNPQAALDPLNKGLTLAIQVDNQEQRALILQAIGVSYRLMNRSDEAMRNFQESMDISRGVGLKRVLANSLSEVAQVQTNIGKADAALSSYGQALQILQDIGMKKDYGDVLINRGAVYIARGEYDKALQDYKDSLQTQRDADDLNYQALCLANIGYVYLQKGDTDNALTYKQQALELRTKLNDPEHLAQALSAIADVYIATGQYDKALGSLLSSLDISHKVNNVKEAASVSDQIGSIYMFQGHLGRAIAASQDAVKGFRAANNYSTGMIDSLNNLGATLAQAGRGDETGPVLDEAQNMARDLKNESVLGGLLNTRGDVAYYRGDMKAARSAYEQAASIATKGKERERALIAKMNLARVALAEGRKQAALTDLRAAVQQADNLHMKYYSIRGSVDMATAMVNLKDYSRARTELERAIPATEKLGLKLESARIHYLLGRILQLTGSTVEASSQYQLAGSLLNEIKSEPGAEKLLQRSDLKIIYDDSTRSLQPPKS